MVVIEKILRLTVEYESGSRRQAWSAEAANFHGLLRRADWAQPADSQEKNVMADSITVDHDKLVTYRLFFYKKTICERHLSRSSGLASIGSILLTIRSFSVQKTKNILAYALVVVPAFLCRGPGADCFFDADRSLRLKGDEGGWFYRLDNR